MEYLKSPFINRRLIGAASLALIFSFNGVLGQTSQNSRIEQIISIARSHLTSKGAEWAKGEAGHIRHGKVAVAQVEEDAARVRDGLLRNAVPDELVLIALVDARKGAGTSQYDSGKLDNSIQNVIETLKDTQMPSEIPRK